MSEGTEDYTQYLFVYGTLLKALGRPVARRLNMEAQHLGVGAMSGRLYNMGYYPAFVPSSGRETWVHGEVLRLLCPEKTFAWLDRYERSGPNEAFSQDYKRVILPARLGNGRFCRAWVYIFDNPPLWRGRHLPMGRFAAVQRRKIPEIQPFSQSTMLRSCSAPKKSATPLLGS